MRTRLGEPVLLGLGYDHMVGGSGLPWAPDPESWDEPNQDPKTFQYLGGAREKLAGLRARLGVERLTNEAGEPLDPSYTNLVRAEYVLASDARLKQPSPIKGVLRRIYVTSDDVISLLITGFRVGDEWIIEPGSEGIPAQPFAVRDPMKGPWFPAGVIPHNPNVDLYPDLNRKVEVGTEIEVMFGNVDSSGHIVSVGAWIDPELDPEPEPG